MWPQAQFLKLHNLGHLKDCESYVYLGALGFINVLDTLLLNCFKKKFFFRSVTIYLQQMWRQRIPCRHICGECFSNVGHR